MIYEYELKISEIKQLSPMSKVIKLDLEGKEFDFKPGQFIMIELDLEDQEGFTVEEGKSKTQKRAFSISSSPTEKEYLELTVKPPENASFVSKYLIDCVKVGDIFKIKGPYGLFVFDKEKSAKNVMLIGAGSGIAPLISVIRYINTNKLDINCKLLFANKIEEEILWREELESIAKNNSKFLYEFTLTREDWQGTKGRIDKEMILRSIDNLEETDFYLCGPPEMVKNIQQILLDFGVVKDKIKREMYG